MGVSNLSAKDRNRLLRVEKILKTFDSSAPYITKAIRGWAEDTESKWQKNLKKLRTEKTKSKVSENKRGGAESTRRPAPKRQSFEQPNMEEDTTGEVYGAYHKEGKKGGGKIKKNYSKGGSVRPASY